MAATIVLKDSYNADEIRAMLPHRPPFLFLDRVTDLVPGKRGVGIKNVTINEPYFAGHFPEESIMPGVLILECLAQLTAIVYLTGALEAASSAGRDGVSSNILASRVGYLAAIKSVKFRRPVYPGDTLTLRATIGSKLGVLSNVEVAALVDGEIVVEGALTVSERPEQS